MCIRDKEYAPQEWQSREKLWNAVEEVETAKDSRLAREFVVALQMCIRDSGNLILEEISGVLTSGLSTVVTNLLASIKLQAYSPPLPIETVEKRR